MIGDSVKDSGMTILKVVDMHPENVILYIAYLKFWRSCSIPKAKKAFSFTKSRRKIAGEVNLR